MDSATTVREFLFTLLLKVAVASSFAALLVRWNTLRRVLFTEQRDPDQKLKLMLFMVPPLILGVTLRLIGGAAYSFADMSLEGAFLMGLLGGRSVGPIGGAIITIPALVGRERSEEHTSELQSPMYLVCRLLLEKKKSDTGRPDGC